MGTLCNHLRLRGTTYWWRRRVPAGPGRGFPAHVCRSLRTKDPALARRRARACSAAFDRAMLSAMGDSAVTREDLKRVLDDIFRRILDDGERERTERPAGPPPWTPEPQEDPRYERLEPEAWHTVPYPPDAWTREWRDAVLMNDQEGVRPLLEDAASLRKLALPRDGTEWRRLSRLALIVAAEAHAINAKREWGDYGDGWPDLSSIPADVMPSRLHEPRAPVAQPAAAPTSPAPPPGPLLSESFRNFMEVEANWNENTRGQAELALRKFISLMSDRRVNSITQEDAESFRNRLKKLPNLLNKSIYRGLTPMDALTLAERLRKQIGTTPKASMVIWREKPITRAEAIRLAEPMTMKTVNRDFGPFRSWGKWMLKADARREFLHRGTSPFAGQAFPKKQVKKEARLQGRERRGFEREELVQMFGTSLFISPPGLAPAETSALQLAQAKYWSILIGLYAGLRLGEVSMLRPTDFRVEDGLPRLRLTDDRLRSFKSEAGARVVPLHPDLVRLGLMDYACAAEALGWTQLLPGCIDTPKQRGANISKWFTRFRRAAGVDGRQTVFHSFRHCFVAAIRNRRGVDEVLIDQIIGHDEYGSVRTIYTGEMDLSLKAQAVAAIDYRIDLTALFRSTEQAQGGSLD